MPKAKEMGCCLLFDLLLVFFEKWDNCTLTDPVPPTVFLTLTPCGNLKK